MRTAAILPVKRFGAAKQRLGEALGTETRATLAAAMFADVLAQLARATQLETIIVVSGEPAAQRLAAEAGATVIDDSADKGQSRAAQAGLARAAARMFDRALLVPGDCPLVDPAELDALLTSHTEDVVIVPDRHGAGTNALVVDPSGPFEPRFGPGSRERHVEQAERKGLTYAVVTVASLNLDIDTGDDLAQLPAALDDAGGRAPRTRGALTQIERARHAA